ncbi:MAG: VTT domain-containing protein [Anaerolineae bacterium]|nr:VTT domain-containing protein [Anaerolineae bacterium]
MDNLTAFLDLYGLAAIFVLMLIKSAGVPIPIPADAIMLATAARAVEGRLVLWQAFILLLIALVVGGTIQYALARRLGRGFLTRFGRYIGITPARLDSVGGRMQKGGPVGIGLAILTPGVRSVAVAACGLAALPLRTVIIGLTLGSGLFLALHFLLGYVGGALLATIGKAVPLPLVIAVVVVLLLIGLAIWFVIRRRQRPDATSREIVTEAFGAWEEATCPVCLALGAASRLGIEPVVEHHH